MEKYELNNIQFALEMNWRKKLGVAILATPAAHGASVFLKDGGKIGKLDWNGYHDRRTF